MSGAATPCSGSRPPNKGCEGTADVGYAVYDRFDLGDQDQRGTVATRYGTREDLGR